MAFGKNIGKAAEGGVGLMSVQIIAEVGECFNGSMERAKQMILEAAESGCDIVKFQILDMDEVDVNDPEYDWFRKIELNRERIRFINDCAKEAEIEVLYTPVSLKTAQYIYDEGIRTVKIASSFIRKRELIEYINEHFTKVYMSTGMASLAEIRQALQILDKPSEVIVLHCISEYPTGPLLECNGLKALDEKDAHLNMLHILKREFPQYKIGYSDHTDGVFVPVIAAAMGAEVIEKHFTLDRKTPVDNYKNGGEYLGTDHVLSVEPQELKEMVSLIRKVEICSGDMQWRRSEGEQILLEFLRGRYVKREN